ncbi:MAG: hypothetical protein A3B25_00260 [Candidatus Ryanbacteria bacterium RIFCSPLOWO2_01_FULL_48_26]|uniref:Uncharacterized protein n=1 Tax=Candidatus Ryanbacteria bacterium RIFCSPLOWO2_01_FULL_48_26 TaxID=1802126 RepID=A0A1G2GRX9_9BACT|nr:MAG: hypothetical protein A3B25_00260 [Candidatus Ryanbacteria bacterium RIFCSPLOWO2_01_FULL_48_26]OHB22693.1 MAG: hypothetical protein A3J67_06140 [Parcubacteria group bacterium RIFCSPHIGHO2_02_FULL_48_10b]
MRLLYPVGIKEGKYFPSENDDILKNTAHRYSGTSRAQTRKIFYLPAGHAREKVRAEKIRGQPTE